MAQDILCQDRPGSAQAFHYLLHFPSPECHLWQEHLQKWVFLSQRYCQYAHLASFSIHPADRRKAATTIRRSHTRWKQSSNGACLQPESWGSNSLPWPWHTVDCGSSIGQSRPGHLQSSTGKLTLGSKRRPSAYEGSKKSVRSRTVTPYMQQYPENTPTRAQPHTKRVTKLSWTAEDGGKQPRGRARFNQHSRESKHLPNFRSLSNLSFQSREPSLTNYPS